MNVAIFILNAASAALAIFAALYWYRSTKIKTPTSFSIHVTRQTLADGSIPINMMTPGAEYVGTGSSGQLNELGRNLTQQSNLNKYASLYAAGAAVCQAIIWLLSLIPTSR